MTNPRGKAASAQELRPKLVALLKERPERTPAELVLLLQQQFPHSGLTEANLLTLITQERNTLVYHWQLHYRYKTEADQKEFHQLRVEWLDRFLDGYWTNHKDFPGYELIRETCRQVFGSSLRDTEIREARERWLKRAKNKPKVIAPEVVAPEVVASEVVEPESKADFLTTQRVESEAMDKLTEVMGELLLARGVIETLKREAVQADARIQELTARALKAEHEGRAWSVTVESLTTALTQFEDKLALAMTHTEAAQSAPATAELTVAELIRAGRGVTITPVYPPPK